MKAQLNHNRGSNNSKEDATPDLSLMASTENPNDIWRELSLKEYDFLNHSFANLGVDEFSYAGFGHE